MAIIFFFSSYYYFVILFSGIALIFNIIFLFQYILIIYKGFIRIFKISAMIYYETTNAELINTNYYKNIQLFVALTSVYCKFLDFTEKIDECVKIWDTMLSRQLSTGHRKKFDTIKFML